MDGREIRKFLRIVVEFTASILKEAARASGWTRHLMTTGAETSYYPFIQTEAHLHNALVHLAKIKPFGRSWTKLLSVMDESPSNMGEVRLLSRGTRIGPFSNRLRTSVKNDWNDCLLHGDADRGKKSLKKWRMISAIAKSEGNSGSLDQTAPSFQQAISKGGWTMIRTQIDRRLLFILYLLSFILLREWLLPVMELTDTSYLGLFLLFVAIVFVLALARVKWWLVVTVKISILSGLFSTFIWVK